MRALYFTTADSGRTRSELRWGEKQGQWRRIGRGVYRLGPDDPSRLDRSLALLVATEGVASGRLAAVLLGLDGVEAVRPEVTLGASANHTRHRVRRRSLDPDGLVEVAGFRCTDGHQTMLDLAADLDDQHWEQALESALRLGLATVAGLTEALPAMGRARTPGVSRARRVLAARPPAAPPTESLLETLALQLARNSHHLGEPERQYVVVDAAGRFVARLDLCWPEIGLFIELDGQQHAGQPVYDARRETAIVAATGWLPGRFTWDEVRRHPVATLRRLDALAVQAKLHQARRV